MEQAGGQFARTGDHLEGQTGALMRKYDITEGYLFISGTTPCKGVGRCFEGLPAMLPPDAQLTVFNKYGRPVGKTIPYIGAPD